MASTEHADTAIRLDAGWRHLTVLWAIPTVVGATAVTARSGSRGALVGVIAGGIVALAAIRAAVVDAEARAGLEPLTAATALTVARASALALLGASLGAGLSAGLHPWFAGAMFAVAAGGDAVDGAVARARDAVTMLGGSLDAEVDGATVLIGATVAVAAGTAVSVFLVVGLARPFFSWARRRRRRRGLPTHDLRPSRLRRPIGAVTMVVTWLAVSPVIGTDTSRLLTAALAIPVAASFARDWLVVSGRL
jgi:CDP-diacylglycerol--glycerol-3-phosphate 3-phosphatidyltransferase